MSAIPDRVCAQCGATFTPIRIKARHNAGRERDSATLRGVDHGDRDINRIVAEAKTKPDCVSAARWRIELRRRANRRYYDFCPI